MLSYDEMNRISEILQLFNTDNTVKKAVVQLIIGEATIYKVKDIVFSDTENGFEIVND